MAEIFDGFEKNATKRQEVENNLHRNLRTESLEQEPTPVMETDSNKPTWTDVGIKNVPVNMIDVSETHVKGPEDFTKVSHTEIVNGFKVLEQEVRPEVEKGATADRFRVLDQVRGLDYPNGSLRVYDAFYGNTAIRLEYDGESYKVINGYHRLYVAQELGLSTVPARVLEKRL